MKQLLLTCFSLLIFSACFCQRYELWVKTSDRNYRVKGNYGFSNDSVLMTYSNASILFPSKEKYFTWDDVTDLKIRNKSRNQVGQLIGTGVGILATSAVYNSLKKESDQDIASIYMVFFAPIIIGSGTLIGHLATNKKRKIPMQEFTSNDKNQNLKNSMKKNKANRKHLK